MSMREYLNREVTIKSTGFRGTIKDFIRKRGFNGVATYRAVIIDVNGKQHELMPHEFELQESSIS